MAGLLCVASEMVESVLLEMNQICKSFPGVRALDKVNLRLERGEVLALLGENGAGKSTLIKALSGAVIPDSGNINPLYNCLFLLRKLFVFVFRHNL